MITQSKDLCVDTWNVLSLYRAVALKLLLEQLNKYKLGIMALQDLCWTGEEILEKKDRTLFILVIKARIGYKFRH